MVKYLVEHDADVNARGIFQMNWNKEKLICYLDSLALLMASYGGYQDMVKCLIEHNANVNAQSMCFKLIRQETSSFII